MGDLPAAGLQGTGISFTWTSTFNGTNGGIAVTNVDQPVDPGSGSGGVTITSFRDTPTYHYNGVVVTEVNGTPIGNDVTPPVVTVSTNPATLWPPNGKLVPVTVSGTITDSEVDASGVNPNSAVYAVQDEYGNVQPSGDLTLDANGAYSVVIQLEASRNGADRDGRHYSVTVSAQDIAGNQASATAVVTVPHDQRL